MYASVNQAIIVSKYDLLNVGAKPSAEPMLA